MDESISIGTLAGRKLVVGEELSKSGRNPTSGLQCRLRSTGETVPAFIDEEDRKVKCFVEVCPLD